MTTTTAPEGVLGTLARQEIRNYVRSKLFWFGTLLWAVLCVSSVLGSDAVYSTTGDGLGSAMALGVSRASLELTRELLDRAGVEIDYDRPAMAQSAAAAAYRQMESDWEAAYLLTLQAAWKADNREPNSLEASMAKAKAGRTATDVTLRCVELAGSVGYSEHDLLEKWARDSKILDIFEGTQQIQQLIVARRLLGKTSAELK